MSRQNKLGRPVRLGLISAGLPSPADARIRRAHSLENINISSSDRAAESVLDAVSERAQQWVAFSVCVGGEVLTGLRYLRALRWLLDAGVDVVVCVSPVREEELHVFGAHQRARSLGVPVIVADSPAHINKAAWAKDVVVAGADQTIDIGQAIWESDPERCRIGMAGGHACAAGMLAGVAVANLEQAIPRLELLDSLRVWALQRDVQAPGAARLAS